MLKNYFIIAFRNLYKHKLYAVINIVGLAIGIAFFTLLVLFIQHELNYDTIHEKKDRTYRAIEYLEQEGIGERSASIPFPLGPVVTEVYSDQIESFVRLFNFQVSNHSITRVDDKGKTHRYTEKHVFFADHTFFEVFDFPLAKGDKATALLDTGAVIISAEAAERYFGNEDPIGKEIIYEGRFPLVITGVFAPKDYQSHFDFDFIGSFNTLKKFLNKDTFSNWVWNPCWTYFVLKPEVSPEDVEVKFMEVVRDSFPDFTKSYANIYLQPLSEIHLYSKLDYELSSNGDIKYIFIFGALAILILVIATINFTNLSTARSSVRAKEIGVRKALGAFREELVLQFLIEYAIIGFIAIDLGMVIIEICLPYLSRLTVTGYDFTKVGLLLPFSVVAGAGLLVCFISSIYPSYYLSKFKPTEALSGTLSQGVRSKMFRSVLVVLQFVITVFLIVSTIVASKQWNYLTNAPLGFKQENLLVLPIASTDASRNFDRFKEAILKSPDIKKVTAMQEILGYKHQTHEFKMDTSENWRFFPSIFVRDDFIETMEIELVAGRPLKKGEEKTALIVNESFVHYQGWEKPEEAIGKEVITSEGPKAIVGIVKNFNFESLKEEVHPFIIGMVDDPFFKFWCTRFLVVRLDSDNQKAGIAHLRKVWRKYIPERVFEYAHAEDLLSQQYEEERKLGEISAYFSLVAIFLACLGMFGLSSFVIDQRKKEIAIRKALGSSDEEVVLLLSKEFIGLVGIAVVVGWIVSYVIMKGWLSNFPFQTSMDIFIFMFAATIAIGITLLTVSFHTIRAARQEPVEMLKR